LFGKSRKITSIDDFKHCFIACFGDKSSVDKTYFYKMTNYTNEIRLYLFKSYLPGFSILNCCLIICIQLAMTNLNAQKLVTELPIVLKSVGDSLDKYRFTDTLIYLDHLEEVKDMADLREDDQLLSYYYYYKGFYNIDRGRYAHASKIFDQAIKTSLSLEYTDHRLLFQVYYQDAFAKSRTSEKKASRKNYWLCYDHAQYLNDSTSLALASYGITSMLIEMQNFREAKKFGMQTLNIDLALNDSIAISHDLSILANIHFRLKMYDNAFTNYKQARSYNIKNQSLHQYCNITNAIAEVAIQLEKYDDAIMYAKEVMALAEKASLNSYFVRGQVHLAHAQYLKGNIELAERLFDNSLSIAIDKKLLREQIRINFLLGKIVDNNTTSVFYLKTALDIAKSAGYDTYYESIYSELNRRIDRFPFSEDNKKLKNEYIAFLEKNQNENQESVIRGMDDSVEMFSLKEKNTELELAVTRQQLDLASAKYRKRLMFFLLAILGLVFLGFYYFQKQKNRIQALEFTKNIIELENQLSIILKDNTTIALPTIEILNSKLVGYLTNKEYQIISDILDEKTNAEIAKKHSVSINTVKFHLKNIHTKLDTPNKKAVIEKISTMLN